MIYFEANDKQLTLIGGYIEVPRKANWFAELSFESGNVPKEGDLCKITAYDKQFKGCVGPGGNWHSKAAVRIRGGVGYDLFTGEPKPSLGDLAQKLDPKDYQDVPVRIPLRDILTACGMRLDASRPAPILEERLSSWVRCAGPASTEVERLLEPYGCYYRVLASGDVGVFDDSVNYVETRLVEDQDFQELDYDPILKQYVMAPDRRLIDHFSSPDGRECDIVTHHVSPHRIRTVYRVRT